MRVVVVCAGGPAPWFAVHTLVASAESARVLKPVWTTSTRPRGGKRRPIIRRLSRAANNLWLRYHLKRQDDAVRRYLGASLPPFPENAEPIPHQDFENPVLLESLMNWKPDLIVTAGAPLLRPSWNTMAPAGCINLHFGIAPAYRGEHTLFFALLEGQADAIGFTIHEIDEGVDTGPIYLRGYPAIAGRESEADLWAKCAQVCARVLPGLARRIIAGEARPVPQTEPGRSFRYVDRSIWDDGRLCFRPPLAPREERIEPSAAGPDIATRR